MKGRVKKVSFYEGPAIAECIDSKDILEMNGDQYSVAAHTGQAKLRPDEETNHSSKEGPREGLQLLIDSEKDAQLLPRGGFMENKTGGVMLPVKMQGRCSINFHCAIPPRH